MRFLLACVTALWASLASASVASDLEHTLELSYQRQRAGLANVFAREINFLFGELPRDTLEPGELLEHRLRMQTWRALTSLYLARHLVDADQGERVAALGLVSQEAAFVGGPRVELPIEPLRKSKWDFARWAVEPGQDDYKLRGGSVIYKGHIFETGDFLLVDLNDAAGGSFSLFNEPRAYLSHFGMFVVIDYNGRRLPAVLEAYTGGLRAVPLNVFVSPDFITYGEIYRLRNRPANWARSLSKAALRALVEEHSYGISEEAASVTGSMRYLTCAKLGSLLLEATGVSPINENTAVSEAGRRNLAALGLKLSKVISPTDYVRDPRVEFVGVLDNLEAAYDVSRQELLSRTRRLFETGTLDPARFPDAYRLKLSAVEAIQGRGLLGDLVLFFGGYKRDRFPLAPAPVLAFIPVFDEAFSRAMDFFEPRYRPSLSAPEKSALAGLSLKEISWWIRPN